MATGNPGLFGFQLLTEPGPHLKSPQNFRTRDRYWPIIILDALINISILALLLSTLSRQARRNVARNVRRFTALHALGKNGVDKHLAGCVMNVSDRN